MSDTKHCAECQSPLPVYWPKGLCAQCAIDGALDMSHAGSQVAKPAVIAPADCIPPQSSPESSTLGSFGAYDLLEEIARGGMGVVYKARQRNLGRIVAVKMILAGSLVGKEFVQRFRTESAAAAILQHPNIVAIHDVGVHDGRHYFSMEYVEAQNLAQLVGQQSLPPAKAARYVETIAAAIHYAHERGILHRDLKPSNVLIDANDQPRITDFGLARRLDGDSSLTLTGQVLGSPNFMPPEQAGGGRGKVGRPSDVYALGGILYHLLTARAPFQAESLEQVISQVLNVEPVSPRLLNPSIPKDLETITLKCLEKEPARRYQTAQELADELSRFLRHEPIHARPITAPEKLLRWGRRKPVLALLIVLLHVVGAAGLTGIVWQWRRAELQQRTTEHHLYVANMNLAQAAWEQNNVTRVRGLLQETATAPERGFEWYYWQRQLHLELMTLRGHHEPIHAVAYAPNGQRIITGSADNTAKVWNAATGEELLTLKGHAHPIRSAVFSSDGRRILTGSWDHTATVWDATNGESVITLRGHDSGIFSAAFSRDGQRIVTGSKDRTAKVWDTATGTLIHTLTGHRGVVWSVAFSADGKRIVTGSWDQTARVWDADTGSNLLTFKAHGGPVFCVAFSPNGEQIVSGSFDQTARVWSAVDGRELFRLLGHSAPVVSVSFSFDGQRIATAGDDQTARVWEAGGGHKLLAVKRHGSPVSSIAFSPDGRRIVTAGGSVAYQPDGQVIVTGRGDKTVKIWETSADAELLTLKGHQADVTSVAFSPDGQRIVSGSLDHTAKVWEAATGRELRTLEGHSGPIRSVAISPDGSRIVTGSWDKTAKVWEAIGDEPRLVLTLDQHSIELLSVTFSPDSRRIITTGKDSAAKVWDSESGAPLLTLTNQTQWVWSATFSPDGRRIVTGNLNENVAKVWDASTGKPLLILKGHKAWIFSAVFSPDGQRIVTGSHDGEARVWDAISGKLQLRLTGHSSWVLSVSVSPDGNRILTGSHDGTAKVWDATSGKELLTLKGHSGWVFSAAFSPDGKRIVTGSGDRTAKVWEAASAEQVANWQKEEQTAAEERRADLR